MRVQKIIPHKLLTRNVHNCLVPSMKGFTMLLYYQKIQLIYYGKLCSNSAILFYPAAISQLYQLIYCHQISAIIIIWLLVGRPTVSPKNSDDEYIFDGIMTLESCPFSSGIVSMFPSVSPSNIRFTQMLMFLVKVFRCFYF